MSLYVHLHHCDISDLKPPYIRCNRLCIGEQVIMRCTRFALPGGGGGGGGIGGGGGCTSGREKSFLYIL